MLGVLSCPFSLFKQAVLEVILKMNIRNGMEIRMDLVGLM